MSVLAPSSLNLMLVTDRRRCGDVISHIAKAVRGGAQAVQIREKDLGAGELYRLTRRALEVTRPYGARLIVNDRLDVALAARADGVHLGWRSLPTAEARRLGGDEFLVGVSVHNPNEAVEAVESGASYVTFGPIFETPSKRGLVDTQGVEHLAECVREVNAPVIAVGGLLPSHAWAIRRCGAAGMAVIRGIMCAKDPEKAAEEYVQAWAHAGAAGGSAAQAG